VSQRIAGFGTPGGTLVNSAVVVPGVFRADLDAKFEVLTDRQVRVNFRRVTFTVGAALPGGGFKVRKDLGVTKVDVAAGETEEEAKKRLAAESVGAWTILYLDDDLRVLRANRGSIFVLKRRGD